MTEKETIKVVTLIVMSYPSNDKFKDDTTLNGMVAVWKNIFKDDNANLVEMAVQKHISVNKWPPSIAEIREQMVNIIRPDIIPPDIAWTAVSDLLYTEGEYSTANIYSVLPASIARVVETIGWRELYNMNCGTTRGSYEGMARVAFMDLYKPVYERERENAMLPDRIRSACDRKRAEMGGSALNMINQAHAKREEQKRLIEGIETEIERKFDEVSAPLQLEAKCGRFL